MVPVESGGKYVVAGHAHHGQKQVEAVLKDEAEKTKQAFNEFLATPEAEYRAYEHANSAANQNTLPV